MEILTSGIPEIWPSDAKSLVRDLRRAYASLERSFDREQYVLRVDPSLSDEIAAEAVALRFCAAELKIWRALRSNSRGAWSKDALYSALYPNGEPVGTIKLVDIYICKMRKRLFVAGSKWQIQTLWGSGYQVRAAVDLVGETMTSRKLDQTQRRELLRALPVASAMDWRHIKQALLGLGISQVAVAKALGVKPRAVFEWCNGVRFAPQHHLRVIAKMVDAELAKVCGLRPTQVAIDNRVLARVQSRVGDGNLTQDAA